MFLTSKTTLANRLVRAYAIVFVISLLCTLTLTYSVTNGILLQNEKRQIKETISTVSKRLSVGEEPYYLGNLTEVLYENAQTDDVIENGDQYYLLRTEKDITNMTASNQDVYIYDLDGQLLFATDESPVALAKQMNKPQAFQHNGRQGYLLAQPIYSEKTGKQIGEVQIFHDLTNVYHIRNWLFIIIVAVHGIFTAIGALVITRISNRYMKPMSQLHSVMKDISETPDDLSVRTGIAATNEIGELSQIFDNMLDQLEEHSKLQSQFVSDVSHELRTPVAILKGHLGMLLRWGKDDPEILEESLQSSYDETERMSMMISDMLDMIRVNGSIEDHKNDIADAVKSAKTVVANFKVLRPDFVFETFFEDESMPVNIYSNHLEQAMTIILDNGVKYSHEDKHIKVSLSRESETVVLKIQDRGEGIGEEDLNHIFERFYRTDKSRNRMSTKSGLGIGLSILKQIIDAYHCRINVESQVNQGTTFTLYLPATEGITETTVD